MICSPSEGEFTVDHFLTRADAESFLNNVLNTDFHNRVVIKQGDLYRIYNMIYGMEDIASNMNDYWYNVDFDWQCYIAEYELSSYRSVELTKEVFEFIEPSENLER